MEKSKLETMKQLFFYPKKTRILVCKNLTHSGYIASSYLGTMMSHKDIEKINSQSYSPGLTREDYIYYSKLEDLYIRKITKDQKETKKEKEALARKIKEKKKVELDENILGKRGLDLDQSKYQIDKPSGNFLQTVPEMKLKYKIEFAKDFLDRTPIDDQEIEPDIMKVNINDIHDNVTCVASNPAFKVIIIGTINGLITAFYLSEDAGESAPVDPDPALNPYWEKEDENDNLEKVLDAKPSEHSLEIKKMDFLGHSNAITSISINFDSCYFISGCVDASVRLWNLKIGHCLAVFKGHLRTVWSVKLSPKGFYFLSGGADNFMFLWSTNSSAPLMSFTEHTDDVTSVDFTENLAYAVSASNDKTIRIWNIENAQVIRVLFFTHPVSSYVANLTLDLR